MLLTCPRVRPAPTGCSGHSPTSQCEYAGLDVTWLQRVWRELHERCVRQDKLQWVLADGRDATTALGTEVDGFHKRIKTAWKLNRRQLGNLVAVCQWREDTARSRDKPRSWIIDDQACLQLALHAPQTLAELRDGAVLPAPVVRRHGEELLDLLAAQREVPEAELPATLAGSARCGTARAGEEAQGAGP